MGCKLCDEKHTRLCKKHSTQVRKARRKLASVIYLGGECKRCKLKTINLSVYDFHHRENKDFKLGNMMFKKWEIVKKELDKCDLLCANCHRTIHNERKENKDFIECLLDYTGPSRIDEIDQLLDLWRGSSGR